MKYNVIRTDTADAGIRKIILYIAQNFEKEIALDEAEKKVIVYAVVDQRQEYLNILRGL